MRQGRFLKDFGRKPEGIGVDDLIVLALSERTSESLPVKGINCGDGCWQSFRASGGGNVLKLDAVCSIWFKDLPGADFAAASAPYATERPSGGSVL